ncbi:hypothetical protein ACF0H5_008273 [Mactra antiquata]
MGGEWLKNMCGRTLEDEAMQRVACPRLELGTHITFKTVQAFGLLGTVLVGPITAAVKPEFRNYEGLKNSVTRAGVGGVVLGAVTGPILTYLVTRKEDQYKVWDRCYRLRYNRCQVRVDRTSMLGAASGAAIGAAYAGMAAFGGVVGMSAGIIFAAIYNNVGSKKE